MDPSSAALHHQEPESLGVLPALTAVFPGGTEGLVYITSREVLFTEAVVAHVLAEHPERVRWIAGHKEDLRRAVQYPEFVSRELEYKERMGHWSLTIGACMGSGGCVALAISLARMRGEPESDFHQVITAYPAKANYFFRTEQSGKRVLKPRWLEVKQKTGS